MKCIKRKIIYIGLFFVLFIFFGAIFKISHEYEGMALRLLGEEGKTIQIFFKSIDNEDFTESNSYSFTTEDEKDEYFINFEQRRVGNIVRIDLSNRASEVFNIYSVEFIKDNQKYIYNSEEIKKEIENGEIYLNGLELCDSKEGLTLKTNSEDSYFIMNIESKVGISLFSVNRKVRSAFAALCAFLLDLYLYKIVSLRDIENFFSEVVKNRKILFNMASNDFRGRFAGSYFGIVWAVVQPLFTILVYWLVFQIGLKSSAVTDVPFALWLSAGLVPWFFFSEAWNASSNVFLEYSYLVKKVLFSLDIMPIIKMISAIYTHIAFLSIVQIIYCFYGFTPTIYTLQIFYYMFAMSTLVLALALITAPVAVFFRDVLQILGIILQFGVWLTPIMWDISIFPLSFVKYFRLNPMYYIVQGYRDSLIRREFFIFEDIQWTCYFWIVTIIILTIGFSCFRRLKEHMADVI